MTATKTARALIASQSLAGGAANVAATWNLTTAFGGTLTARVTNGAAAPTIAASVTVNVSTDGATWRLFATVTAGLANNEVDDFVFQIPPTVMYAQVSIGGNTAQAVTIESYGQELTSIA